MTVLSDRRAWNEVTDRGGRYLAARRSASEERGARRGEIVRTEIVFVRGKSTFDHVDRSRTAVAAFVLRAKSLVHGYVRSRRVNQVKQRSSTSFSTSFSAASAS